MLAKAGRHDVVKLVTTYERGVYGNEHMQTTNGYEARRQAALAEGVSSRLKAGAAASALALVPTKLASGESTDGAVFFPSNGTAAWPRHAHRSHRRRDLRIPLRRRASRQIANLTNLPAPAAPAPESLPRASAVADRAWHSSSPET